MMTRKQFGGKLLSAVAAGSLANYSLVANAMSLSSLERGFNDKCNESGKSDQCHGKGNKSDTDEPLPPEPPPSPPAPPDSGSCKAPAPDAEPACNADTCSQADAPTGNE